MEKLRLVTDSTFNEVVLKAGQPVLVDFWATRCKPCLMVAPILEELSAEYSGRLTIAQMDIDRNTQTAQKYHVMSLPSLILFKEGQPVKNIVGFKPKTALKQELDTALG
jgi:thioredoxin 1